MLHLDKHLDIIKEAPTKFTVVALQLQDFNTREIDKGPLRLSVCPFIPPLNEVSACLIYTRPPS